jgi:hypothetical protein
MELFIQYCARWSIVIWCAKLWEPHRLPIEHLLQFVISHCLREFEFHCEQLLHFSLQLPLNLIRSS